MKFLKLVLSILLIIICLILLVKSPPALIIMGILASLYSIYEAIYWQYRINKEKDPKKIVIAEKKLRDAISGIFRW